MENSSQEVSPFVVIEARVGVIKIELVDVISETIIDGVGDEPSGNGKLKRGKASSGDVTEEEDGDDGGTMIGCGLKEEHRILSWCSAYG